MNLLARFLALPWVFAWLLKRAQRTPYSHIQSPDGKDVYMFRWWLFNPYDQETRETRFKWCPISIRVHRIMRRDLDRDLHDHPWDARTFILKGWYIEKRQTWPRFLLHRQGETAQIQHTDFHQITDVSDGGVYTLFITGRYRHTWGFLVGGLKVPYRQYLEK